MEIQAIGAAATMNFPQHLDSAQAAGDGSFGTLLTNLVTQANETERGATDLVESMARGEPTDIHTVMTAVTEADLSFRMLLEVRNKLMDAWQEVHRMPV